MVKGSPSVRMRNPRQQRERRRKSFNNRHAESLDCGSGDKDVACSKLMSRLGELAKEMNPICKPRDRCALLEPAPFWAFADNLQLQSGDFGCNPAEGVDKVSSRFRATSLPIEIIACGNILLPSDPVRADVSIGS